MSIPGSASPLFIGAAAGAAAAYQIDRSIRLNDGDSAYLNRTPSSSSNETVWTFSFWIKLNKVDGNRMILTSYVDSSNDSMIKINGNGYLEIYNYRSGAYKTQYISNARFRDPSSWYHFVISANDSTSLNAWVNGVAITFSTSTGPDGTDWLFNGTNSHQIGRYNTTANSDFQLAEVQWVDGQALAASDFGEYDSNSVWQPKEYSGTYGTPVNQAETWSSVIKAGGTSYSPSDSDTGFLSAYAATKAFDFATTSSIAYTNDESVWIYFTPATALTVSSTIRFGARNTVEIKINGTDYSYTGGDTTANQTIRSISFSGSLTTFAIRDDDNSGYSTGLSFLEIDGVLLVDNGVTVPDNSFYLKFADNSSNAALGTDTSGNSNTFTVNNLTAAVVPVDVGGDPTVSSSDKPFTTGFSVAFDGNDKMRMEGPGTVSGDFTWECWVKFTGTPDGRFFSAEESVNGTEYSLMRFYNGNLNVYAGDNNGYEANTYTGSVSADTWHHIAMVRSGSTLSHYLDGSRWDTNSYSGSFPITTLVLAHGYSGEYFTGSVSNARFVNGQALYTGTSYTVPTATLTTTSQSATASNVTTLVAHKSSLTANDGTKIEILNSSSDIDSLIDTPTNYTADSGNNGGNYCTMNPLKSRLTLSNGNLDSTSPTGWKGAAGTIGMSSGKYYWEIDNVVSNEHVVGIVKYNTANVTWNTTYGYGAETGVKYLATGGVSYGAAWTTGDVIGVAFDADNGNLEFYKNGTSQGVAATGLTDGPYLPSMVHNGSSRSASINFGQRPWRYSPKADHVALCTTNLADPTVADGSTAFDIDLYTGTGSTHERSNFSFNPDLVWIKNRSSTYEHLLFDSVRGATKYLKSNSTALEQSNNNVLTSFDNDGFTLGNDNEINKSSETYAAWAWDAGTSTVSNTDGSVTSSVRASQTNGFSIVGFTGGGSGSTFGHGLNAAPHMIIVKDRDVSSDWCIYHKETGGGNFTKLNSTDASAANTTMWGNTDPTSSVFGWGFGSGNDYIAYCFAPVAGYSAFGTYEGTASSNFTEPFVYTGMRPRWILVKNADDGTSAADWFIYDTARSTFNAVDDQLYPNRNNAEAATSTHAFDILSNGFKVRTTSTSALSNKNGDTYIYAAFSDKAFSLNGGLAR